MIVNIREGGKIRGRDRVVMFIFIAESKYRLKMIIFEIFPVCDKYFI